MSSATASQNIARYLMWFGFIAIVASVAVSGVKLALIQDVYDELEAEDLNPVTGQPMPALFDAEEGERPAEGMTEDQAQETTLATWQDVMTITPWENALRFLGLASLLTAILVIFRMSIFKNAEVVQVAMPRFWQAFLAASTGRTAEMREALKLDRLEREAT